jgi:hypothetical protein
MSQRSFLRVVVTALAIWIAGVVVIRLADSLVLTEGPGFLIGYGVAALAGPPTVWAAARMTGYSIREIVPATLVICMIALPLDGLVMGFFPTVYTDPSRIHFLAPLFLWAFGWACISAFVMAGGARGFANTARGQQ